VKNVDIERRWTKKRKRKSDGDVVMREEELDLYTKSLSVVRCKIDIFFLEKMENLKRFNYKPYKVYLS